jgi:hypothetical protein
VAGGVADGKEDWFVLLSGFLKGLFSPGKPIHWIEGMLPEVGAFLVLEAVRIHGFVR